jgi:hypothetical protein
MGLIYSRTVSFYREASQLAAGNVGYLGHKVSTETLIAGPVAASIQCPSVGAQRLGDGRLPDDTPGPVRWNIFLAPGSIAKGTIITRDIAIDDEGNRYMVSSAYWNPISWKIQTIRLEA